MQRKKFQAILLSFILIAGCSKSTDSGSGGSDGGIEPATYTLNVDINPDGSGSVNPSSGTFEEGTQISVSADANQGWEFDQWKGDIQSEDNPLVFTINQNTQLTGNFVDISSDYTVNLTVNDSLDVIKLVFGQIENATRAFDRNFDKEAPPSPPEGTFYSYFKNNKNRLFRDFRNLNSKEEIWKLKYTIGSGDSLGINWEIDKRKMSGTLILTDTKNTFEIDMLKQQTFQVAANISDSLSIQYKFTSQ